MHAACKAAWVGGMELDTGPPAIHPLKKNDFFYGEDQFRSGLIRIGPTRSDLGSRNRSRSNFDSGPLKFEFGIETRPTRSPILIQGLELDQPRTGPMVKYTLQVQL